MKRKISPVLVRFNGRHLRKTHHRVRGKLRLTRLFASTPYASLAIAKHQLRP